MRPKEKFYSNKPWDIETETVRDKIKALGFMMQ